MGEKIKHTQIERILNDWIYDTFKANLNQPIGFEVYGNNIYIYTSFPGILIGLRGTNIDRLKVMLKENGIKKKIHFIELGHGNWVKEINVKRKLW